MGKKSLVKRLAEIYYELLLWQMKVTHRTGGLKRCPDHGLWYDPVQEGGCERCEKQNE